MEENSAPAGGGLTPPPPGLPRWNWGAFLLSWIWGLGNGVPRALWTLVPGLNFVMPFVLGVRGNAWAWRSGHWRDAADFRRSQRTWGWIGFGVWLGAFVLGGLFALIFLALFLSMTHSGPYRLATTRLDRDPQSLALLGRPIRTGMPFGSIREINAGGWARLSIRVHGPRAAGWLEVRAVRERGRWRLIRLRLQLDGQANTYDLMPPLQVRNRAHPPGGAWPGPVT